MALTTLEYAKELVRRASPSLQSNVDVSDFAEECLRRLGFEIERLEYLDDAGVKKVNVLGKKGRGTGGLAFFGHTDTVPAEGWTMGNPFEPFERDGKLYGRGSCDMKGPVACMLSAAARFEPGVLERPLYLVFTADEEIGYGGARQVEARSTLFSEIKSCRGVVGEPTRLEVIHGHKGTVLMQAVSIGRAAHSSTANGINANLKMIPFLADVKAIHDELQSDERHWNLEFDPPMPGFNIGINDGNRAVNITPPRSVCTVYYRPMPGDDISVLIERIRSRAVAHGLEFSVPRNCGPLYTDPRSPWVQEALAIAGKEFARTVPYGTDGAVFGQHLPIVVCGPGDIAQAHTVDEWIEIDQLDRGVDLYSRLIERFCVVG